MEKRRLGRTGMEVNCIGFGALPMQRCTMAEAGEVLHAALDQGINFIDTARAYTDSEEKIGRHISSRRSEYYLASKSLKRTKEGMAQDIDTSLKLMKTEYIDLYQIHNVKKREEYEQAMGPSGALEALKEAQQAGKIRFIGITGHDYDMLVEGIKTNEFSTVQAPFNAVEPKPLERLFPLAKQMDIGRIVMKPLGGGQIENKVLALRYILAQDITVAIPGMDHPDHVRENLSAAEPFIPLSAAEQAILDAEVAQLGKNFCRRCGYCLPCAQGIDIPATFITHLQYARYGMTVAGAAKYAALPAKASACIQCGICETRCPYDLPIRERLKQIAQEMG
ncbi:MAG TPA: aldo/keto reductase [Negativicutes bacterium]|nr:aldo/keto reductase [Negativicutes bacterium]